MDGCKRAGKGPEFGKVTIVLGDDVSVDIAGLKLKCTKAALENIRREVSIKTLHIYLKDVCWGIEALREGLARLKIGKLGIFGAEYHWEENLRLFPATLGMSVCPAYMCIKNGCFECGYLPALTAGQTEEKEVV